MLIADGGGGYGGTDWNSKDVRYMWSAIVDQETDRHFDVVSGWRQTADLTLTHLGQVQMYRDNLASVWPPSKSPAAAAYLDRLDDLITSLKATHEAASANYTAFSTVALTLSLARNKLKPIFDQYEANENANLAWQAKQDAQPVDPTEPPKFALPPVSSAQQEQLNNQARVIMYDLSSTVISGQVALQKPKPYDPDPYSRDQSPKKDDGGSSGSSFAAPPVIPPPGGGDFQSSSSPSRPVPATGAGPVGSTHITPGSAGHIGSGGGGTGPVLGGIGTTPVTTPTPLPSTLPPVGNPVPTPTATSPGIVPGVIAPGGTPRLPTSGNFIANGRLPESSAMKFGGGTIPAGRMAIPSGGVIGATPGSGLIGQMPTQNPGSRTPAGGRANPVGGVIGQQGGSPSGRSGARPGGSTNPHSAVLQPQSRSTRGRSDEDSNRTWDPDNPWATDEGVDPVLLPPDESGPIDPGPAIGLTR